MIYNNDLDLKKDKPIDSSIKISPDDLDDRILEVLKTATDKKISLSIESICYILDLNQEHIHQLRKRLRMLQKFGYIRKICERITSFWALDVKPAAAAASLKKNQVIIYE